MYHGRGRRPESYVQSWSYFVAGGTNLTSGNTEWKPAIFISIGILFLSLACNLGAALSVPAPPTEIPTERDLAESLDPTSTLAISPTDEEPTTAPRSPRPSPTPDPIREMPKLRDWTEVYTVRYGDTLNNIAYQYEVAVSQIVEANGLLNPNLLGVGWVLTIPPPIPEPPGPSLKIIPDSELIFGPSTIDSKLMNKGISLQGSLAQYEEAIEDRVVSGPEIVMRVAENHSINPRLLIAILEYQSHWASTKVEFTADELYPLRWFESGKEGLYNQLSWAADQLNTAYYRWKAGWAGPYIFSDGRVVPPGAGANAGTVAVQYLFSQLYDVDHWRNVVGLDGFPQMLDDLFGDPFELSVEPLIAGDVRQPRLELPFEHGALWSFTGGPHSAFGNTTAWAALDFAPSGNVLGCVTSNEWVVAATDGMVVRSGRGQVVQDLDGDGSEQTGWAIVYLHIETRDRIPAGTMLRTGDRIGHPSCEGGVSTGTHVHISRKYNGEWIAADGKVPFELGGWVASGSGTQYNGSLTMGDTTLLACACRASYNQISW